MYELAKPPPSAAFPSPQMVFKLLLCHEGSEYVLNFEILQREGDFYSARTDTPNRALVYRFLFI